jgi:hypothetical protein
VISSDDIHCTILTLLNMFRRLCLGQSMNWMKRV